MDTSSGKANKLMDEKPKIIKSVASYFVLIGKRKWQTLPRFEFIYFVIASNINIFLRPIEPNMKVDIKTFKGNYGSAVIAIFTPIDILYHRK